MSIATCISRQFDVVWETVGEAVALVPDDEWATGEDGPSTPVHQLAHIAAAIALYLPPPGKHWPPWCENETGNFDWRVRPVAGVAARLVRSLLRRRKGRRGRLARDAGR